MQVHWIPIAERIKFIIIIFLTFKGLHELSPSYMKELLTLYCPAHMLQSSSSSLLARTDYNSEDLWWQGVCHLHHWALESVTW